MPPDFSRRSTENEIMDGGIDTFALFDESLTQIESINRLTMGYRPVLLWLNRQLSGHGGYPVTIFDIGSGRGDLLRQIWHAARHKAAAVQLTGIDIDAWSATAARQATPEYMNIGYRVANVFDVEETADFIVCSHTTHHMDDETLVRFIRWLETHARRGWFICDLHRHPAAYLFSKVLLSVVPVNPMVRNDGAVSVTRAFTASDWRRILERAGVSADVSWHFPFRYGIAHVKDVRPPSLSS
ncbi:MAG: methyltransferase domain-containing protein [Alphaproteobacteria bacterium]